MIDHRFHKNHGPFLLKDLVSKSSVEVKQPYDESMVIEDVATLGEANSRHLTYCEGKKYLQDLRTCQAGACILPEALLESISSSIVPLVSSQPRRVFAQLTRLFYPEVACESHVAATAIIHPTAQVSPDASIGDYAIIGEGAIIGPRCSIGAHVIIGPQVHLGEACHIEPFVHIQYSILGRRVTVKTGAKIGQKGFGFEMDESGPIDVPQLGRVVIEDGVEIGANTAIDRGTNTDTVIGSGSRIDNLVQIAHNVKVGKHCILIAQVGIAGSTQLGNAVIMAGQAGAAGHLTIGDRARIAAQCGLMRDVLPGETLAGSPAVPVRDWHRQTILLQRLIHNKESKP